MQIHIVSFRLTVLKYLKNITKTQTTVRRRSV